MAFIKLFLALCITFAVSFDALADKIYKTVNESGAVEFSDKKTPDAKKMKVKPNVVEVKTPVMPEPTAEKKAAEVKLKKATKEEAPGRGTATAGNLKRKLQNAGKSPGDINRPPHVRPIPAKRSGAGAGSGAGGGGRGGGR